MDQHRRAVWCGLLLGLLLVSLVVLLRSTIVPEPTPGTARPQTPATPPLSSPAWVKNGATRLDGEAAVLTDGRAQNQSGSIFWRTPLTAIGRTVVFDIVMSGGTGADGMTMTLAGNGATATSLGLAGGGLGFSGVPGVAVAFDTNGNGTSANGGLVGIATGGANGGLTYRSSALLPALRSTSHHVEVDIGVDRLAVRVDGNHLLTAEVTVPRRALLGFTAATGGLTDVHTVRSVAVVPTPARSGDGRRPPAPAPDQRLFSTTGMGGSVRDAANGGFNTWAGQRLAMYATWADNGRVFSIDTPGSEYGANSVDRLGDYDLDVSPQIRIDSWAGVAGGSSDAAHRRTFETIKAKWGDRAGQVFIRPFHEMNGNWYQWSVRRSADQAYFLTAWREHIWPIFWDVFEGDPRFHLVWSPNRDSSYGLDVRKIWPGKEYVHAIGLDYYDFGEPRTEADWAAEEFDAEHGGSPVGIGAWQRFAAEQGVPWYLPEWGVQFGDNPLFAERVLGYVWQHRFDGVGDGAGKCLGAVWHNLKVASSTVTGGGDFLVQVAGKDHPARPNTATVVREWLVANSSVLRAAK